MNYLRKVTPHEPEPVRRLPGKAGWVAIWVLGIPLPALLLLYFFMH